MDRIVEEGGVRANNREVYHVHVAGKRKLLAERIQLDVLRNSIWQQDSSVINSEANIVVHVIEMSVQHAHTIRHVAFVNVLVVEGVDEVHLGDRSGASRAGQRRHCADQITVVGGAEQDKLLFASGWQVGLGSLVVEDVESTQTSGNVEFCRFHCVVMVE